MEILSLLGEPMIRAAIRPHPRLLPLLAGSPIQVEQQTLDPGCQWLCRIFRWARGERVPAPHEIEDSRHEMDRMAPMLTQGPTRPVEIQSHSLAAPPDAPAGSPTIPSRVYRPAGATRPVPGVVFYHGGGFVQGSARSHDPATAALADALDSIVVSVDYRLAPEHPAPAAADDCLEAYRRVQAAADSLGVLPGRIAVAGDSAGGNLAAVVAQQAKPAGLTPPAYQLLIYPVTDHTRSSDDFRPFDRGFILTAEAVLWYRARYLEGGVEPTDPRVSPLLAPDLSGLPPAIVVTAGFDPLQREGLEYAERLRDAGVFVKTLHYPSLIHGFANMTGAIPAAGAAMAEVHRETAALATRFS